MSLPKWPGADSVYSKLYKVLERMGAENWKRAVAQAKKRGVKVKPPAPTEEQDFIIRALAKGEETLKALALLRYRVK
jgi:hypothetical protein